MLEFRYDTQLLIEGENLDEDKINEYFTNNFKGDCLLAVGDEELIKDLYPHAIRHTFCSRCFEKGMDAKVVQMLMGHQHYSTTIDIYTHVTETKFEEEIAKFGSVSEKQKVQKNKNSTQCA